MQDGKTKWVFWSTRDSINNDVLSVSAVIETIIAVPLYWWFAAHFETYLPLLAAAVVAPLVLLRSEQSVALGIQWFSNFERTGWPQSEVEISGKHNKWVGWTAFVACSVLYLMGLSLLIRYIVLGTEGWPTFMWGVGIGWISLSSTSALLTLLESAETKIEKGRGVALLIVGEIIFLVLIATFSVGWAFAGGVAVGAGVFFPTVAFKLPFSLSFLLSLSFAAGIPIGILIFSVVARVLATLRYIGPGLKNLSANFFRLVLCTSPSQVPELVPGLDSRSSLFTLSHVWQNTRDKIESREGYALAAFVFASSVLMWFLPAWFYRLTLKSTAWLWWPIAFLGSPPKLARNPHWFYAQRAETKWAKSTAPLAYLSIAAFLGAGLWQTLGQGETLENPFLSVFGYALSVNWSTSPWQLLGFAGSVLTLVVIYLSDWIFRKYVIATHTNDVDLREEAKRQMRAVEHLSRLRTIMFLAYCAIVGLHASLVLNGRACWVVPAPSIQRWSEWLYREYAPILRCPKPDPSLNLEGLNYNTQLLSFTFYTSRCTLLPISLNFRLIAAMPSSMAPLTDIPTLAGSFSVAA